MSARADAKRPFAGVRVLDLTRLLPGGFCTMMLADFGAEVIKVEDVARGDYVRWAPPFYDGVHPTAASAIFLSLNRNKRSVRINLKNEDGKAAMLRLVRSADVVVDSFRPGVMDRLGFTYEHLRDENPGIVVCAISGYGQTGPMSDQVGHDLNYIAQCGILDLTGPTEGPPVQPSVQIADIAGGGLMAAFGIVAALRQRDHSGLGQFVDISMTDGALSLFATAAGAYLCDGNAPQRGHREPVCYRPYQCSDGWASIAALEEKFWRNWCEAVNRPDLIEHQFDPPKSWAHSEVAAIFAARSRAEWAQFASEVESCVAPVQTLAEALDSELARKREMVVTMRQPGSEDVRQLGAPVKLAQTPADPTGPAPVLGADTADVLASVGYGSDEILDMEMSGAVAGPAEGRQDSFLGGGIRSAAR